MAESFTYHLSTSDLFNTTITDGNDRVYYWIETELNGYTSLSRSNITYIYRASPFGKKELVFRIEFDTSYESSDGSIFSAVEDRTSSIRYIFPRHGLAPRHRDMPTPRGEFKWSRTGVFSTEITLEDPSKETVAEYDTNSHLFGKSTPTIKVSGTALALPLDMIVLGVTVMKHDRDQAGKRAAIHQHQWDQHGIRVDL
ncbi:hypothetical protein DL93DRAFT_850483 [Clavulina sp. PMI_390]|nr:hypothetical protein DL93DRAFT_850483 [Clavulina sp. PMI_390]